MNLLLDTHVFIWAVSDASQLSDKARDLIRDPEHVKWFSLVSAWEMQIKLQIGKLTLEKPLTDLIAEQREQNDLQVLPITLPHILSLSDLPLHHRDPFDRLLIAQAVEQDLVLLSQDAAFADYDVSIMW
jgi:PIN domain nuclease of toxin-antitoxin system